MKPIRQEIPWVEQVAHLLTCPCCSERFGDDEAGARERATPDYGAMWGRLDDKLRQAAARLDVIEDPLGFDAGGEAE